MRLPGARRRAASTCACARLPRRSGPARRRVGRDAHRHLERELRPLPDRPGRGLRAASRDRRTRPPGDQGPRRPVADDGPRGAGLRRRDLRPQPVERRRDRLPGRHRGRPARLRRRCPGTATRWPPRRGRSAPPATGSGCGRSTSPTAARSATRTWTTSSPGSRRCATHAAGWLAEDPDRAVALTGDWNIAPRDEDVFDIAQFAKSTHVTPPERAAFQAVVDAGLRRRRAPAPPGPGRLHLLGLLPAALRAEPRHADRLRARLPGPRRRGSPARRSTATSGPARAPATTPR